MANSGTTELQIAKAESRIGITFPESYKLFIRTTNGLELSDPLFGRLLSIDEIGRYNDLSPESLAAWQETPSDVPDELYNVYGDDQDTVNYRSEYLTDAIQISDEFDGLVILLIPSTLNDNEMECWCLASWYPGAARYRSFYDFLNEGFDDDE